MSTLTYLGSVEEGSPGKRLPGQFAREAAFFDVEEREEEGAGHTRYREVA
jgi:hypothetical protein